MIIATSITKDYLDKSKPFFESVNKNFNGRKVCFCMGFETKITGWQCVSIPVNHLRCKIEGFPKNREEFLTLQYGEFVDYYDFEDSDTVMFVDSDMILQRGLELDFDYKQEGLFLATNSSFPPTTIKEVVENLKCKKPTQDFLKSYDLIGSEKEFCSGFLIAKVSAWKELFEYSKKLLPYFFNDFEHHAAWQLLINIAILKNDKLDYLILNPIVCNADWYFGSQAIQDGNLLKYHGDIVYFNHTKFDKRWN